MSISSTTHPTGIWQQCGTEGIYPLKRGFFSWFFEVVHTSPNLYLRDQVDYIVNRRKSNLESGVTVTKNFLGCEYGNDAIVVATGIGNSSEHILSTTLILTYMWHGETNMEPLGLAVHLL